MREVRVQSGQIVNISVRDGMNVDSAVWGNDAETFRPERWLERGGSGGGEEELGQKNMTFGDGPKVCLGRLFALAEMKVRHKCLIVFY